MSMENVVSLEELEKRRQKANEKRKPSHLPAVAETESEALNIINEIFDPSLKVAKTVKSKKGPYKPPDEFTNIDVESLDLQDLDIKKLAELKEVFTLFDTDSDGLISKDDLRFTFSALGSEADEGQIDDMVNEAKEPLDFEAFLELMSHRTLELDPEDVLLEAWSKWDDFGTGRVEEEKMFIELTNYGDKLSNSEASEALRHAPLAKPKSLEDPPMIDYPAFCHMLCGMRKQN